MCWLFLGHWSSFTIGDCTFGLDFQFLSFADLFTGKPSHYIDAKNEAKSNWMRFVNCARDEKEQNLVAFQYLGQIYYRSFKPIPAGTELLVYYGKDYARDLGIERLFPDESKRSKLEDAGTVWILCNLIILVYVCAADSLGKSLFHFDQVQVSSDHLK